MKKFACLLFALVLCVTSIVTLAESVPSKTTADLTSVDVAAENLPEKSAFSVLLVTDDETEYQKLLDIKNAEVTKLTAAERVEAYFGEGIDLKAIVGAEQLNVNEFMPIVISGYEEAYGKVTLTMLFSTPYEAGEKVAVMIGLVTENTITWKAFEGVGVAGVQVEAAGSIQVELDAETILAIQNGTALLAIVSD